ncbi:hypothetical protein TNCV_2001881 [Trichonephila clavipes]|nr:hypothetical protein TNCV_2001881 [Trichonephila clavipes]
MVAARSPAESRSRPGSMLSRMCERVSVEIGVHPVFIWRHLHFRILERILYFVRLISFDWSRVSVWRGNVSPFARVRPQRWGKKDAFHQIPFLVNRANVKTAVVTLGTGDLPSLFESHRAVERAVFYAVIGLCNSEDRDQRHSYRRISRINDTGPPSYRGPNICE